MGIHLAAGSEEWVTSQGGLGQCDQSPLSLQADAGVANKYRAVRTNGYASKREASRAAELKLLEKAGRITHLQEQVVFVLVPKSAGERAVTYRADFVYLENGQQVVEDTKGYRTPVYRLKRRLMQHIHDITIREV